MYLWQWHVLHALVVLLKCAWMILYPIKQSPAYLLRSSINGQQQVNGRMIPKRFERLEIDTTRLLTADAGPDDNTIKDTQRIKEYRTRVFDIALLICFFCIIIGAALLIMYAYMLDQEKKDSTTSLLPQQLFISGCVFMALAFMPGAVCCVILIKDEGPAKQRTDGEAMDAAKDGRRIKMPGW